MMLLSGIGLLGVIVLALKERLPDRDADSKWRRARERPSGGERNEASHHPDWVDVSFSSDGKRLLTEYDADEGPMFGEFLRCLTLWTLKAARKCGPSRSQLRY